MLNFIKQNWRWCLGLTICAALLRLYFILKLSNIQGDSLVYGEIAKGLVTQHMYGVEHANGWAPTLIRLPGYPLFLAFTFLLFGVDHYIGAMLFQLVFDVLTCFLVADIARRIFSERAARIALLISALCPFLMSYVAAPLTESIEIFFTAAAFDAVLLALDSRLLRWWAAAGAAIAGAILLLPDGGILLGCIGLPVLALMWRESNRRRELFLGILLLGAVSLSPLAPWAIRNYRVFHVFQPLVRPEAIDPNETIAYGYGHWLNTWVFDYTNTLDLGFPVPGEPIRFEDVPDRAFTSPDQREIVRELFRQYNQVNDFSAEADREFEAMARANIRRHPLRHYIVLPFMRTLDMWFRPRTEMLPLDAHFWRFRADPHDSSWSIALGVLNLLYVAAAIAGAWMLRRRWFLIALLLTYPVLRTLFLAATNAFEDRYTMECFPAIFVLAAGWLAHLQTQRSIAHPVPERTKARA